MSTKHTVRKPEVISIHEEWAEKNGYRVAASNKQQAASTHPDLLPKHGPEYYAPRRKRRASSNKRQALNGASSNKR